MSGVQSLTVSGTGLAISPSSGTGALQISNTGAKSIGALTNSGIEVLNEAGDYLLENTGVKSIVAGKGITLTPSTGVGFVTAAAPGVSAGANMRVVDGPTQTISTLLDVNFNSVTVANDFSATKSLRAGPTLFSNSLAGTVTLGSGGTANVVASKGYNPALISKAVVLLNYGPGTLTNPAILRYSTPVVDFNSVTFTISSSDSSDVSPVSYLVVFA